MMFTTTRSAIKAAVDFLENDQARAALGLHKIRVNGDLMTRGEVADTLRAALAVEQAVKPESPLAPLTEKRLAELVQTHTWAMGREEGGTSFDHQRFVRDVLAAVKAAPTLDQAVAALTPEQRQELLHPYCNRCYGPAPCHCWNDE